MTAGWQISSEIEEPFREALDHAAKRRVDELRAMPDRLSNEQIASTVGLCAFVSAYTAIDVVERRWPSDAGVRRMAERTVEGVEEDRPYGVTEENVYLWLSKVALGFKTYAEVFGDRFDDPRDFYAAPFFLTINFVATFIPKDKSLGDFLDIIEDAYERAWVTDLNLLPALMVRARMPQPEAASDGSGGSR
ncbi:MAG: hypothetical protein J2P25_19760 [Nocardiopsaceae bacterium]|nr:hypothetical protein [Nocardiopsaceae bacterium]